MLRHRQWLLAILIVALGGCASIIEQLDIKAPTLSLGGIELISASLSKQTFRLDFDVANSNPIAIPIESLTYAVDIAGQRFAAGKTSERFRVPANGETRFSIAIDSDLMSVARTLSAALTGGTTESVDYSLSGSVAVDLPLTQPFAFQHDGSVDVQR